MTLFRASSSRAAVFLLAGVLGLSGCARSAGPPPGETPRVAETLRVAVFPITNLSGVAAPLNELRQALIKGLADRGISVLDEGSLQGFMDRHRLRYIAGMDAETGRGLREETGADAVLITSLEGYVAAYPPRVSLTLRLVSTANDQKILWMDGFGFAGDDSPGLLGLGLIRDPKRILEKSVSALLDSLSERLSGVEQASKKAPKRFLPETEYRSPVFSPDTNYRLVVLPFFDKSGRKNAGDIMVLQFISAMYRYNNFTVIEPGVVRRMMLGYRIILDKGVSLPNADTLFDALGADLVLSGTVFRYEDGTGPSGSPVVEFSVYLIDRKSREVVWSSRSSNTGDDVVHVFDVGRVNSAKALAARMVRLVVEKIVEKR